MKNYFKNKARHIKKTSKAKYLSIGILIFLIMSITSACTSELQIAVSGSVKDSEQVSSIEENKGKSNEPEGKQEGEEEAKGNNSISHSSSGELKVHFIDVGQADSILVQQGNKFMLVDAGNNDDEKVLKNYLESQGVKELQYFIGTHAHEDHIGSADYIINSFKVGKVYFPKQTATTKTFENFITAVRSTVGSMTAPKVGETFQFGGAVVEVMGPNSESYKQANDYSIVVKISFGETSFLLTGDAEATSEMEMVKKGLRLKSTVLKVGHHGSKSSSTANFLQAVNPSYAVISVGKDNSYGHPEQSVLDRLKGQNIEVYRTDESGTIVAVSDGKNVSFNAAPYKVVASIKSISESNKETVSDKNSNKQISEEQSQVTLVKEDKAAEDKVNMDKDRGSDKNAFYVPNGKSYHYNKQCSTLSRSKTILEAKLQVVIDLGKADPCDKCIPQ